LTSAPRYDRMRSDSSWLSSTILRRRRRAWSKVSARSGGGAGSTLGEREDLPLREHRVHKHALSSRHRVDADHWVQILELVADIVGVASLVGVERHVAATERGVTGA